MLTDKYPTRALLSDPPRTYQPDLDVEIISSIRAALQSDDMPRRKAASINLDTIFRSGSAAHKIAERLMAGKPQTRYELVEGLGTSVTTVNRVVGQLEKAGAIITREIGSDGKQAVFRLVDVTGPKAARPYLHLGERVRVVAARLSGDDMLVDVFNGQGHFPGRSPRRGHKREPRQLRHGPGH